ncbi:hypothetical protein MUP77_09915 [Candidatus Bathyarchaeota archaeon]|nr:hypothetical protein [Candidatus Bathyarchaeota archaeon]
MPETVEQAPTPLRLLDGFSEYCREKGWTTGEFRDFVKLEGEYYCFVWIRSSHHRMIPEILKDNRNSLYEEGNYSIRNSYRALIFQDPAPFSLICALSGDERLSESIAIYDLSPFYKGESVCKSFNRTMALVYQEFEDYLHKRYGIVFKPIEQV